MNSLDLNEVEARPDPLHDAGVTAAVWTTVNTAEALPGVATPLGWTWFFEACELGVRGAFADIGALPARQVRVPDRLDERFVAIFYGHFAGNLDMMRRIGDQMPGSSGDAVEAQYFGQAREGITSSRSVARTPIVIAKLPVNAWRARRKLERLQREIDAWWRRSVAPGSTRGDVEEARAAFRDARHYWLVTCRAHTIASMIAQGLYEQVRRMSEATGQLGLEQRLLSSEHGLDETQTIADLWNVANGKRSMEDFLATHGFHGPREGELSSRSWREDPGPLEALLDAYRRQAAPDELVALRRAERVEAEASLRDALRGANRWKCRPLLRLARIFMPLREQGRATFLRAYDVARCMARRIGTHLVDEAVLDDPDDAFYLTVDELLDELPPDPRATIAFRRARRELYLGLELPERWEGSPRAIAVVQAPGSRRPSDIGDRSIDAIGASPGTIEGRAVVVVDPLDVDQVQDGDILVCHTTDPSWASLFFLVSACVIDIGGAMSHGAILARELGIPCVINTRAGTKTLHTGDRVRVDGTLGTVEVLVPAAP
jgi:phosphohistidine swiveling domain-containing protein